MPAGDESLDRLRAAIDELAAEEAADVLSQAREQARQRVSSILSDALTNSLLEHVHAQLPGRSAQLGGRADAEELQARGEAGANLSRRPTSASPRTHAAPNRSSALAWYVYGVIGTELRPPLEGIQGIEGGQPVAVVAEGSLAAIVSRVTLDEFEETRLREHLADMAWIETTARAHDAVLNAVRDVTTVIPMRLCTVYRNEDSLRQLLRRESTALRSALGHLAGKTEWGVKVFTQPRKRKSTAGTARSLQDEGVSGSAYMQGVRRELDREEHEAHLVDQASAQIHDRLCALACEGLMLAVQRPEVTGHRGQMILNGAYLVRDEDQGAFHEEIQQMRSRFASLGLDVSTSGPWPPYNFLPGVIGVTW